MLPWYLDKKMFTVWIIFVLDAEQNFSSDFPAFFFICYLPLVKMCNKHLKKKTPQSKSNETEYKTCFFKVLPHILLFSKDIRV